MPDLLSCKYFGVAGNVLAYGTISLECFLFHKQKEESDTGLVYTRTPLHRTRVLVWINTLAQKKRVLVPIMDLRRQTRGTLVCLALGVAQGLTTLPAITHRALCALRVEDIWRWITFKDKLHFEKVYQIHPPPPFYIMLNSRNSCYYWCLFVENIMD